MKTIQFDEVVEVKSISEFTIRDREWFTYYNDKSKTIRVVDKILGASLPKNVNNEKQAREFLFVMTNGVIEAVVQNMIFYLNKNNIKYPINENTGELIK